MPRHTAAGKGRVLPASRVMNWLHGPSNILDPDRRDAGRRQTEYPIKPTTTTAADHDFSLAGWTWTTARSGTTTPFLVVSRGGGSANFSVRPSSVSLSASDDLRHVFKVREVG